MIGETRGGTVVSGPRIAVVGCGYWGKNLVRNFHELGALKTVCDADAERLQALRAQYGVETALSYSDILADPALEAVVVATPAECHAAMVREALLAGKDVFVEKPLALAVEEGAALVETAKRLGRTLMVGHLLHYHGAVRKLKELVSGGELGRVRYVYSNRLNLGKIRREENILWSFAPHDVSVILSLANEAPEGLACQGGSYLHAKIADVTVSTLAFGSGLRAHIFVSWLHPYKEQKLVVVGETKMAVFDDMEPVEKLRLYGHQIDWREGMPVPVKAEAESVDFDRSEPLREECRHFLECVSTRRRPLTDGDEGLRVLGVLQSLQQSLDRGGETVTFTPAKERGYFVHPTAVVDEPCSIARGVKVWHFSHVSRDCRIGEGSNLGQNVFVAPSVVIGRNAKIQNNVSLYEGVELGDDVFCGPSMVFTNVLNPRSHVSRKHEYRKTLVARGATLGANCTVVCGHDVGEYAFVGAGAVVTKDVPPYALVVGNPARQIGWMCRCGVRLPGDLACQACGITYHRRAGGLAPSDET
ncbi:MAG: Gfo/Idh/MocA family oxidoreductase [Proteobacteria bacterium]|nr:Gfo/Idh/MocA family oxidoreductase [Pseudomonadota bacterium]